MVRVVQHPGRERVLIASRSARLYVLGRQLLVNRVMVEGWSLVKTAQAQRVRGKAIPKWIRRYQAQGEIGLQEALANNLLDHV